MTSTSKPAGKIIHLRCSESIAHSLGFSRSPMTLRELQLACWNRRVTDTVIAVLTDIGNDYHWPCDMGRTA
jgi:hypothetical protein